MFVVHKPLTPSVTDTSELRFTSVLNQDVNWADADQHVFDAIQKNKNKRNISYKKPIKY